MNNSITQPHSPDQDYPLEREYEDDLDTDIASEHEKETYIKHIRQNLCCYRTYCTAEDVAKAIGGAFTGAFVIGICADSQEPVKTILRNGKRYIAIAPFLDKLKACLTFEDAPK